MNIYEIRKLGKPQNIPPIKVLKCEKCGSTENLHLYNYPDPYDMGWGYNPHLFCEICNVPESADMKDRGRYDPILHGTYLKAGGINYQNIQWADYFICYDCHQICGINDDGKTEKRGYTHLNDKSHNERGETVTIEFCMNCWTASHMIDEPIIDILVYDKGSDWRCNLLEFKNSPNQFDKEYASYLLGSHEIISILSERISRLSGFRSDNKRKIYKALKNKTKNLPLLDRFKLLKLYENIINATENNLKIADLTENEINNINILVYL